MQSAIDKMLKSGEIDCYIKTSALFGDNIKNVFDEAIYRAYIKKNDQVGHFNQEERERKDSIPEI